MSDFADLLCPEAQGFPDFLQFYLHRTDLPLCFFVMSCFHPRQVEIILLLHFIARRSVLAAELPRSANRLQAQIYQHMHINLSYMSVFLLLHIIQHVGEGSQNSLRERLKSRKRDVIIQ